MQMIKINENISMYMLKTGENILIDILDKYTSTSMIVTEETAIEILAKLFKVINEG